MGHSTLAELMTYYILHQTRMQFPVRIGARNFIQKYSKVLPHYWWRNYDSGTSHLVGAATLELEHILRAVALRHPLLSDLFLTRLRRGDPTGRPIVSAVMRMLVKRSNELAVEQSNRKNIAFRVRHGASHHT